MKTALAALGAILLAAGKPAGAHRLDEYLQATILSVEKNRVQAQIRLTPGVAVLPIVLARIDTDADGVISEIEQRAYASRVLRDLSLAVDGDHLRLQLVSMKFPKAEEMRDGRGEIQLDFSANLPPNGPDRRLIFENHHQSSIGAYLVNCLVPRDPDIRVTGQNRNYQQSFYQLDYVESDARSGLSLLSGWRGARGWLGIVALVLFARLMLVWRPRPAPGRNMVG